MELLSKIRLLAFSNCKIPVSYPIKFFERGVRFKLIPFSSVAVLLKKLFLGRPGLESTSLFILLVVIFNWSPTPAASPSKEAKPILAFTGSGEGTVLKP